MQEADAPRPTPWSTVAGELATCLVGVATYLLVRGAVAPGDPEQALRRAEWIIDFETSLGLFREPAWQLAIIDHRWLVEFANAVYLFGMHPVMLFTGIWLCRRSLAQFRVVKHVLLVSACIGCLCYALLPTAPPRLLLGDASGGEFVDTLNGDTGATVQDTQPEVLRNDYAAIPSYHFAWIMLMAVAISTATRKWVARVVAATFTATMGWAIVATGNHLFFDLVLGVAAVALSWLAVSAVSASGKRVPSPLTAPRRRAGGLAANDSSDWTAN